jgi:hypothetical protein
MKIPSSLANLTALLKEIFSPIVDVANVASSSIVCPLEFVNFAASSSVLKSLAIKMLPISLTRATNLSFLETKSVSEFTSYITPNLSLTRVDTKPSAAILPDFLTALAIPFSCNHLIASLISPLVASKAFLQSIKPLPVNSLNSLIGFPDIKLLLLF